MWQAFIDMFSLCLSSSALMLSVVVGAGLRPLAFVAISRHVHHFVVGLLVHAFALSMCQASGCLGACCVRLQYIQIVSTGPSRM